MQLRFILKLLKKVFLTAIVSICILFVYWYYRPNNSNQIPELSIESWSVVNNGKHNAFTDLIYWKGEFYLTYRIADFHSGSIKSKIVTMSSPDAKKWKELALLDGNGSDIRDPKFAIVRDRLFIFTLKGAHFFASPTKSAYSFSTDGKSWTKFEDINFTGWLIWRPKTADGITWYAPFFWHNLGQSYLMKSTDCINWSFTGKLYNGDNANETEMTFVNDSTLMAVGRAVFSNNYIAFKQYL